MVSTREKLGATTVAVLETARSAGGIVAKRSGPYQPWRYTGADLREALGGATVARALNKGWIKTSKPVEAVPIELHVTITPTGAAVLAAHYAGDAKEGKGRE